MKTKALISFAVTAKLICVFVFAYAKSRFSHDAAHIVLNLLILVHIVSLLLASKSTMGDILVNFFSFCHMYIQRSSEDFLSRIFLTIIN